MDAFKYAAEGFSPHGYECSGCGAFGCRLWRQWNTFTDYIKLLCLSCAESDQKRVADAIDPAGHRGAVSMIGDLVAAIPTEDGDTYWGYTSVPKEGVAWWYTLPLGPVRPVEPCANCDRLVARIHELEQSIINDANERAESERNQ